MLEIFVWSTGPSHQPALSHQGLKLTVLKHQGGIVKLLTWTTHQFLHIPPVTPEPYPGIIPNEGVPIPSFYYFWNYITHALTQIQTRLGLQCQTPLRSYPLTLDTWPLPLMPYPLSIISYSLSLIPNPCSLTHSTVPLKKFRWGLLLSLSLLLLSLLLLLLSLSSSSPSSSSSSLLLAASVVLFFYSQMCPPSIHRFPFAWIQPCCSLTRLHGDSQELLYMLCI